MNAATASRLTSNCSETVANCGSRASAACVNARGAANADLTLASPVATAARRPTNPSDVFDVKCSHLWAALSRPSLYGVHPARCSDAARWPLSKRPIEELAL